MGIDYLPATWTDYRDFLSRSLIYLAPSSGSEWALLEARASGCCVLSLEPASRTDSINHADGNEQGTSGDPNEIVALIEDLLTNPGKAIMMGQRGKTTTLAQYDSNRYAQEWMRYLEMVVGSSGKDVTVSGQMIDQRIGGQSPRR